MAALEKERGELMITKGHIAKGERTVRNRRVSPQLGILVAVLFVLAACAPAAAPSPSAAPAKPAGQAAAAPASGEPYKIGVTFPLTGPQAAWGTLLVPAVEMGVQDVNDAGGVSGRPLSLVVEDSKGDPQAAVAAMRKVVQVDRVPVVQTIFTNVVTAQMTLADQLKVPIISTIEAPGLTDRSPYNFANSVTMADVLPLHSQHWQNQGYMKMFAFLPNTSIGEIYSPLLKGEAEKLGIQYDEARFKLGETDFRGLVSRAKDFGPDMIITAGHGTIDEANIMRQARELGIQVPLYGSCGCITAKSYREAMGELAEGFTFTTLKYDPQAAEKFITAYRQKMGFDPDYAALENYDIVFMIRDAIARGGYTGDGIQKALSEIKDFQSIGGGTISMGPNRQTKQTVAMYQIRNGQVTEIQP